MEADAVVKPEAVWLQEDDLIVSKLKKEPEAEEVPGCDPFTFTPGCIKKKSQNHVDVKNEPVLSAYFWDEGNRKLNSGTDIEETCHLEDSSECNYSAEEMDCEVTVKPKSIWLVEDMEMSQAHVKDEGLISAADSDKINKELKTEIDIGESCILGDSSEFIQSCKGAGDANVLENEGINISSTDKLQAVEGSMLEYEEQLIVNIEKKQERKISIKEYSREVHQSFTKCTLTSETQFKCDICGIGFKTYSNIVQHIKSHTLDKPFQCEVCNKCFTLSGSLKIHMRLHTGEKLFKCEECSKCFTLLSNLKIHMNLHTGLKPFKCEECSNCFTQSGHLKRHLMAHAGQKPFKCKECSKCFTQSGHLKRHLMTHTGVKPFKCMECSKCFAQSGNLKLHMKTHT